MPRALREISLLMMLIVIVLRSGDCFYSLDTCVDQAQASHPDEWLRPPIRPMRVACRFLIF
ncbi:hypothetical protein BJF95_03410 [Rhizobium oryziradicis]|uniref:Uncharacterized protein n=1 Tax=Rhizobium oryziradicis TaxID=1867956 RepID=A0A1Q8ZVV2_9HYPH|nr:hypothetical protein BJF95_03410 [Rhizobium oryziradicis]